MADDPVITDPELYRVIFENEDSLLCHCRSVREKLALRASIFTIEALTRCNLICDFFL